MYSPWVWRVERVSGSVDRLDTTVITGRNEIEIGTDIERERRREVGVRGL